MGLGIAQRAGFITSGGGDGHAHVHPAGGDEDDVLYICPMMCTPPQTEPGRCPVCGMELVPTTSGGEKSDSLAVHIEPAARRVANIQTVAVETKPVTRTIRAIGELSYDEGTLKTISAYVDGRLERLYADYTGVVVQKGDPLAILYSPQLYSSQIELLLARRARDESRTATLARVAQSSQSLYENSKRRLIELGMTAQQIADLEQAGEANSRLHVFAPIGGTVIEKLAVEGQYVQEGEPIYRLADLSSVWLMLRLFPEDAAAVRVGQQVDAQVQSLPGRSFTGHVAFIDPSVDPKTRTVGVRVAIPNEDALLRVGDYAKAEVEVPANVGSTVAQVVPRDAVLMTGGQSVVYVETTPGRFEIRRVVLGPSHGNEIVIQSGLEEGEQVATRGNFLIDSQMQLAGNPSLIDPLKAAAQPAGTVPIEAKPDAIVAALAKLSAEERTQAEAQQICPVTELALGSMGTPLKVDANGTPVFICCGGCREQLLADPAMYLEKLSTRRDAEPQPEEESALDLPPIGAMQLVEPVALNHQSAGTEPLRQAQTATTEAVR